MNRRKFLISAGALGLTATAYFGNQFWPDAGIFNPCLAEPLPDTLQQHPLMQQIWQDIDTSQMWDSHVHLVGTGDSDSGIWFNPNMDSWLHPVLKIQKEFYMDGACAEPSNVDVSSVIKLLALMDQMPKGCKSMLFAFDWFHNEDGQPNKQNSIFYIPNSYAAALANSHPERFEWVASIHPYRADAVDALEQAKAAGARAIKWLPPGMGIDPASTKCDAFYKKAAALKLPIISHTGRESAVQGGNQNHGNPLRLRRALDHGVRVVLAHCASDGDDEDLDNNNKRVKSVDLFARLMDTPEYQHLAFGEISALTLVNHAWAIKRILMRTDWHSRLINGSDYPLPNIFPLINVKQLHQLKLLDASHLTFLTELKRYNPLMYDFAAKRLIQFDGIRFDKNVFETKHLFS